MVLSFCRELASYVPKAHRLLLPHDAFSVDSIHAAGFTQRVCDFSVAALQRQVDSDGRARHELSIRVVIA